MVDRMYTISSKSSHGCITAIAAACPDRMSVVNDFNNFISPHSDHAHQILTRDQKGSFKSRICIHSLNKPVQENSDWEMIKIEEGQYSLKYTAQTTACELPSMDDLLGVMQKCNNLAYAECLHIHVHSFGLEAYDVPGTRLVSIHMACGNITVAEQVFQKLLHWDVYAWTSLLEGYVELGDYIFALDLIPKMQASSVSLDKFAFLALLKASARLKYGKKGQELHMDITKQGLDEDSFLGNSLLDMYAKCGLLAEAGQAFDRLPAQDVISWNTLLAGYVEHELIEEALGSLQQMRLKGTPPNGVTYTCSLKACGCVGALEKGYELHTSILKEGYEIDTFVSSGLVDMYARCNSQAEAHRVFDVMSNRSVVAWTALTAGYAEQGLTAEVLYCLQQMQLEGVLPNARTFVCVLKACCLTGALDKGQEVHAAIVMEGLEKNMFVCNTLVDMYIKCNSFADAQEVFNEAAIRDVALWNVMISGYAEHGREQEAIEFLDQMQVEGVASSSASLICILKSCCNVSIDVIFNIHGHIFKYGFERGSFIGSSLVDVYSKAGLLSEAQKVFDTLQQRCVVSWNSLIDGHAELGLGHEVLKCLELMGYEEVSANAVSYLCGLKACASVGAVERGLEIHTCIVELGFERDDFVGNSLVDMYAKCGLLAEAQKEFDNLVTRNSVSYVALLAGYVQHGHVERALQCVEKLQMEICLMDGVTYGCILKACGAIGALKKGQEIHSEISKEGFESDRLVVMNLMAMYVKNGLLVEAQEVFDDSLVQDVVLWSVLIEGYADQGLGQEALSCWDQMQSNNVFPDNVAFICIFRACAIVRALERGQEIHCTLVTEGLEMDYFIGNTLIDMYSKCGLHGEAREVFDELGVRDRVSWNIMILSYAEQEESEHALPLYQQMLEQGISPDSATFVNVLTACGNAVALEVGKRVHVQICALENFKDVEPVLTSAIIDMYGKCGSMTNAQQVFDTLLTRDLMKWTALISGYARQGQSELAILMFDKMREDGIYPSGITYISVLTACSHDGLVEKGHEYYEAMCRGYNIIPTPSHHNCMLALLGRAGQLKEALLMIEELPAQPNAATWSTVLSACQMWAHMEVGKHIFDSRVILDKMNVSAFIMMSNIYADAQIGE